METDRGEDAYRSDHDDHGDIIIIIAAGCGDDFGVRLEDEEDVPNGSYYEDDGGDVRASRLVMMTTTNGGYACLHDDHDHDHHDANDDSGGGGGGGDDDADDDDDAFCASYVDVASAGLCTLLPGGLVCKLCMMIVLGWQHLQLIRGSIVNMP